jgi:hypothetical protein
MRTIHGICKLPNAYCLVEVPAATPLKQYSPATPASGAAVSTTTSQLDRKALHLGSSYNIPKVLVGLFQFVWGIITLFRAKGTQIEIYGYAAFGLSVAPYALMSLVNIATALVTPEYAAMYLVHTPDLDQAEKEEGTGGSEGEENRFDGMVAAIDFDKVTEPLSLDPGVDDKILSHIALGFLLIAAPFAIVGLLSGFRPAGSTTSQRGWMMTWYVVGAASSFWVRLMLHHSGILNTDEDGKFSIFEAVFAWMIVVVPLWAPAIGGMVMVGLMLRDYGVCTLLDF